MDASLLIDHLSIPSPQGTQVRALLSMSGQVPTDRDRAPIGLALVLDRSGSMDGDRLDAAVAAAALAVDRLHPDDVVSAVAFDHDVQVVASPAWRKSQTGLAQSLRALRSGGSTNLSGGWLRGRQDMQDALPLLGDLAGSSRRIVLLTDGHANHGITEPAVLLELARTARANGISTTTIGVGEGYDDDLLRGIADAGGGNAWYVEKPDQAHDVLAEELGALLSVCAQGLRVELTLSESVEIAMVHSTWPSTRPQPGVLLFDLGDLYASEPKPLLLELFVPASVTVPAAQPVATLTVSADVLLAGGGVEHRQIVLPIGLTLDGQQEMQPQIELAILLARAAKAREAAALRQREGDGDGARALMASASDELAQSALRNNAEYFAELSEQVNDLSSLAERYAANAFDELDAKYQMQRSYNARRGKRKFDAVLSRREEP